MDCLLAVICFLDVTSMFPASTDALSSLPLADFSPIDWFWESWWELKSYVKRLGRLQWMILSGCVCVLGMLCLRGNPIGR